MADKPKYNAKQTAAHYRGVAAGAKRANDMKASSGGGGKPPAKKGCWLTAAFFLVALYAIGATLYAVGVVAYNVIF